jgi:alkaline phosphatase D
MLIRLCSCLALILFTAFEADAQHDPQRNATQAIAVENFTKAEKELAKADEGDPETLFVRMMLALKKGETDAAVGLAEKSLGAGLSFYRLVAGPRGLLQPLYETDWYAERFADWEEGHGAGGVLVHGPMVGRVTGDSASIWVRTSEAAKVRVFCNGKAFGPVSTESDSGFVAVVEVTGLEPGKSYSYAVGVNDLFQPLFSFRTFPDAGSKGKFRVAFGGGAGFVPKWEYMWDTIGKVEPHALLMLGDNVYIDQPEYLLTHDYCYFRRQARPEWRKLTASTAVYSIYDDHDFGTNDCVPGPEIEVPAWKRQVWNKFRENWVNPAYGGGEEQPGCWYDFMIGDVHFILLDGRYYRDRKGGSMLGPAQKVWLKETLKKSTGTFKVLASPVPWTEGIKPGSKDPWDGFADEREEIFSFIETEKVEGVFLIAADRHRTDLRTTSRPNGYKLYEFESSRLTNRHTHPVVKTPGLIWGYSKTCSFGLMRFDTAVEDPQVTFECITIDGEVKHDYLLKRSALVF